MNTSLSEVASLLKGQDHILILTHQFPDGDTLGAACALALGLRALGKRARIECADPIPPKYAYLFEKVLPDAFAPDFVVAVDVADEKLLGKKLSEWAGKVDLCIDHHGSNTRYAREYCVDPGAAATCEMIGDLLRLFGVPWDAAMAACLYTGLSTDTGCFRYSNTTPKTHRMAAELIECGAKAAEINRLMFETKTRERMEIERMALEQLRFFYNAKCAVLTITREMVRRSGATESDLEGLAPIPRQIEGVLVGVTLREKEGGDFKVSLRTAPGIDASRICARMGGGGHPQAAGCTVPGGPERAREEVVALIGAFLEEYEA